MIKRGSPSWDAHATDRTAIASLRTVMQKSSNVSKRPERRDPELPFNEVAVARIGKLVAQTASEPRKPKTRR